MFWLKNSKETAAEACWDVGSPGPFVPTTDFFQGIFLDQTWFFLTWNESTASPFLWKQKHNSSLKILSFDLNFQIKIILKYIGWFSLAVFIIQNCLAVKNFKDNTTMYITQTLFHLYIFTSKFFLFYIFTSKFVTVQMCSQLWSKLETLILIA